MDAPRSLAKSARCAGSWLRCRFRCWSSRGRGLGTRVLLQETRAILDGPSRNNNRYIVVAKLRSRQVKGKIRHLPACSAAASQLLPQIVRNLCASVLEDLDDQVQRDWLVHTTAVLCRWLGQVKSSLESSGPRGTTGSWRSSVGSRLAWLTWVRVGSVGGFCRPIKRAKGTALEFRRGCLRTTRCLPFLRCPRLQKRCVRCHDNGDVHLAAFVWRAVRTMHATRATSPLEGQEHDRPAPPLSWKKQKTMRVRDQRATHHGTFQKITLPSIVGPFALWSTLESAR